MKILNHILEGFIPIMGLKNGYPISVNLPKSVKVKNFGIRVDDVNNSIIA